MIALLTVLAQAKDPRNASGGEGIRWAEVIVAFAVFLIVFVILLFVYYLVRNLLRSQEPPTVSARRELDGLKHLLTSGEIDPEEYHVMRKRITERFAGMGKPLPSDWEGPMPEAARTGKSPEGKSSEGKPPQAGPDRDTPGEPPPDDEDNDVEDTDGKG